MKRLVCIVEGKGEVEAIPNLCMRILASTLETARGSSTRIRSANLAAGWWTGRARARSAVVTPTACATPCCSRAPEAHAVLVLCDADDDCPATWGPDTARVVNELMPGDAVMAVCEYETWLLLNFAEDALQRAGVPMPESKRGAKEVLKRLVRATCRRRTS